MIEYKELFIGGDWTPPAFSEMHEVISPSTEEIVGTVPATSTADVDHAVAVARRAFDEGPWPRTSVAERAAAIERLATAIETRAQELATAITHAVGAPLQIAGGQPILSAMVARSDAALIRELPLRERRQGMLQQASVEHEPVGVAATIPAWNGSLLMNVMKMTPALATGCTVVAKPALESPLDAFLLAQAIEEADLPDGVVSILPAGAHVGRHLVRHPGVDMVSFTGSVATGREVGAACAADLKRCVLELGGKSAAIVLGDADLPTLVEGMMLGAFGNSGQMCNGFTRLLVPQSRHDEFVDAVVEGARSLIVGDPFDPATQLGPLGSRAQRERVEDYIASGLSEGARLALGGGRGPQERGWYVEPTVFVDVDNGMRVAREEIFGPVLCVIPYDGSDDDAVAIANDSPMGLHGAVFSADEQHALELARRVRTGTFSINAFSVNPGVPFGGYKCSGLGRESGIEGIKSFLEVKSINLPAGLASESTDGG